MDQFSEKIQQALGDWKIAGYLGAGQYGKVYEIQRMDFGTVYRAALKIITIPQSDEEVKEIRTAGMNDTEVSNYFKSIVEDFVREFALMAKLKGHTNIVGYEDHQVIPADDGIGWTILIRMELLTSLINYVSEHPMTRRDVIKLGIDLCRALELCQRVNVIHRDIKPANIFVSEMGEYKLGDFGVARIVENTMSGRTGTDTYMAPEVYYEEKYGPSADIYSLGIVMYRLLNSNRAPFLPLPPKAVTYRDNAEAFRRRINGEELPLPNQADGRLAEIVLKACAYRTADRYSSPVAMRKDLEAILYEESEAQEIYPDGDKVSDYEGLRTNGTVSVKDFRKGKVQEQTETSDYEAKDQRQEAEPVTSEETASDEKQTDGDADEAEKQQDLPNSKENERIDGDYCGDETVMIRRKGWNIGENEPEKPEEKGESEAQVVEEGIGQKTQEEVDDQEEEAGKTELEIEEENNESRPEEPEKKSRKKLFLVIPAAAVAVTGAVAALYLYQSSKFSVIPDVCGVTLSEAEDKLQEAGFMAEMQREYSDTVPENVVISQDMAEGEKQEKGSMVNLIVSAGEEPIVVPDVLTKRKKEAVKELEGAGFSVVVEEQYRRDKVNTVASQSIKAGTETQRGQEIVLVVSKKRPDIKGLSLQDALAVLQREGFTLAEVNGKSSSKAELNTVLGVSYQIAEGKTAEISLNCIQVPDIIQMEKSEAVAALTAAGFSEENISSEQEYNSDVDAGIVYECQIQEEDWAALAGIPEGVILTLGEGKVPQGAKISFKVSLGAKPKPNTGSSNYSAPAYTPAPPSDASHDVSHDADGDEGVVFSDGEGRLVY